MIDSGSRWVAAICGGSGLIAVAFASAWMATPVPRWGVLAMIVGTAVVIAATAAAGASRSHLGRGSIAFIALFLLATIALGFGAPLWLPVETASSPLILGLPARAAIEIYGVGLMPSLVLPVLFAWTFRSDGIDERGLHAMRVECARLRGAEAPEAD